MGSMSLFHWIIVGVVILLLFGNRLPSVMRSLGRGMVEFKKGMQGLDDDAEPEPPKRMEGPSQPQQQPASTTQQTGQS
jgi:sec-independent protein translocase protein TatA